MIEVSQASGLGENERRGDKMLKLALFFFIVSIIAGVFGFTGISVAAAGIAKVLFFVFLIAFVVLLVFGLVVGRPSSRAVVSGAAGLAEWPMRIIAHLLPSSP